MRERRLPGTKKTFSSVYSVENAEANELAYFIELYNEIPQGSVAPGPRSGFEERIHEYFVLRPSVKNGHINGPRYFVDSMKNNALISLVATENNKFMWLTLPRVPCNADNDDLPVSDFNKI